MRLTRLPIVKIVASSAIGSAVTFFDWFPTAKKSEATVSTYLSEASMPQTNNVR
jgi:hypothetical protein